MSWTVAGRVTYVDPLQEDHPKRSRTQHFRGCTASPTSKHSTATTENFSCGMYDIKGLERGMVCALRTESYSVHHSPVLVGGEDVACEEFLHLSYALTPCSGNLNTFTQHLLDTGRDCRNRLARPNSQARTGTGKYSFSLFS